MSDPAMQCETPTEDLQALVRVTLSRLSKTGGLPTLPSAVTRALTAIRNPAADLDEVCQLVETDIGIAARVLRLANSPMFTRGRRYATLKDALVAVGLKALGEILMAASLSNMYASTDAVAQHLWNHAVATGIACRALAPRFGQRPDQAFMVGLFHDIGGFAFHSADPGGFEAIAAMRVHETRCELERQWYGFDHTEAGKALVAEWGFAEEAIEAIRWHHDPSQARQGGELARLVMVADALTHTIALGGVGETTAEADVLDAHLSRDEQVTYAAEIEQEIGEQRQLFA